MKVAKVIQELFHDYARYAQSAPMSEPIMFNVLDLQKEDGLWESWKDKPGIYYFVRETEGGVDFKYVGRALPGTLLGARVYANLKPTGKEWDKIINDPKVSVGIVPFDDELWHLLPSLEIDLIDILKPTFNKRMG